MKFESTCVLKKSHFSCLEASGLARHVGTFGEAWSKAGAALPWAGGGDVLWAASADQDIPILLKVAHAQRSRTGLDWPELAAEGPCGSELAEVAKHIRPPHEVPAIEHGCMSAGQGFSISQTMAERGHAHDLLMTPMIITS